MSNEKKHDMFYYYCCYDGTAVRHCLFHRGKYDFNCCKCCNEDTCRIHLKKDLEIVGRRPGVVTAVYNEDHVQDTSKKTTQKLFAGSLTGTSRPPAMRTAFLNPSRHSSISSGLSDDSST